MKKEIPPMIYEFKIYLSKVVGLNDETCNRYARSVQRFAVYCDKHQTTLKQADTPTINAFIASLELKPSSLIPILSALRRYYQFLIYRGIIKQSPAKAVPSPKRTRFERPQFGVEDIAALLRATPSGPIGVRNRAIMTLLYATGIRCSEAAHIKLIDVDLDNKLLRIFGKNAKERLAPINDIAMDCLQTYLSLRPLLFSEGHSSPYIFITKVQNHSPLNRNTIWKIVKNAAKKAGLGDEFTTHNLRHCFATHMVQHGANLRVIQELLGHAQLSTTQIYTQLDKDHLKALHSEYHPRAK